ncbi:bifunctional diaminohydroxyphosphoribosylaminopyrimidine deaminase/5-amino-6-(5-phosphoribosylamino)uracil reductase RibD [Nesterenkonia flava]|uniref:Riboflavin biosynthesis protein RibD n=1 Tax=Nesterenkonia flava TaxID=469799 RepID=A0ABU1FVG3_9MICC|nr:bifunctional diaminohydroxyphosphoribosylaminopyrimidine deaminase/5-amino-6-(5-phosphoribosylamino)uracil reductase RibD [Nesterenkonia flava]MDR5712662.1 bifunctional diaminohydroxyphosphoribosylaminopyrimidine deaminase/5-amino-6-(5-phosphoribosylamino)uracil reductase RibD [Nesterenkonia flava]
MPGADDAHHGLMRQALDAALQGHRGANPLVGAVLVDDNGAVLATGHHRGAGTYHAERDAIESARARGVTDFSATTLYTTLEPCRHEGRQPACTRQILEAGIGRVTCGAADPSANGGGAQLLREAGLDITTAVLEEECTRLNHRWNLAQIQHRPFVTVHLAQSLDARIAAADGTSQWITSAPSRQHTHRIRERVDAILVGTNTAVVDDPRLTARTEDGELAESQPLRCVMGLRDLPRGAKLTQDKPEGQGWMQLRTRDPLEALRTLAATRHNGYPVKHALVEGGQSVLSALFAADLVDEIFAYIAPLLLGEGRSTLGDIGVTTLDEALRFRLDPADGGPVTQMGPDVCLHLTPEGP